MRDRAFGVEIECGYQYEGNGDCPCECVCETCHLCEYGCDETLEEDEECSCECECYECELCRYGCEADHESYGCESAAQLLIEHGFREWVEDIHGDGSGVEMPSPILHGREGLNELRDVMKLLRDNGFYTTNADGLHVHHEASDFAADESLVARLVELWEENLPVIDRFVASYRRGGSYWACNSYQQPYSHSQEAWARFKASKSLGDLSRDKFRSLNVAPLSHMGTIEFRLHEGTLDFNRAAAWIHFGQEFLEAAKRTRNVVTCASVIDLLRFTRTSPSTTRTLVAKASGKEYAYA